MAAAAGVDLDDRNTRGVNAFGIVHGLLVPFDHKKRKLLLQGRDGFLEQRGLPGAGRTDEIQCSDILRLEITAVALGQLVVVGEDVLLQLDFAVFPVRMAVMMVPVGMGMPMIV